MAALGNNVRERSLVMEREEIEVLFGRGEPVRIVRPVEQCAHPVYLVEMSSGGDMHS